MRAKAIIWTIEEKEYLKKIVKGKHHKEITELMNERFERTFTQDQVKAAINRYKLNTGFSGRFEKGNVPINKGTKGMSKANSGSFKKGQEAINRREVGSERINIYGYIEIKIAEPNIWALKHKLIWEQHYGPIEKGNLILFADSNRTNVDIKNLILVSNKQLLMMNRKKLIKDDADLTKTGLIIAELYQKIYDKKATLRVK